MSKKKKRSKSANAARAAEEKRTVRIRLLIACAAVLLLIAAAVAVGIMLSGDSDDGPIAKTALKITDIEDILTEYKQSGVAASNYVFNENDLAAKGEELSKVGVSAEAKAGCYAASRDGEVFAYEFASEEQATAFYDYYISNSVSGWGAQRRGKIVIYGTGEILSTLTARIDLYFF